MVINMSKIALSRLTRAFNAAKYIPFDNNSKIIIMSDCHRGVRNWADNFAHNQNIYFAALSYYYDHGFTYIELGDGDELWENRSYDEIIDSHNNVYWLLSKFNKKNRLYMLYGNHDIVKRDPAFIDKVCKTTNNPCQKNDITLFYDINFYEGLVLYNIEEQYKIFLTHGHQADIFNDIFWRLSRFLVRYLWGPLELIGLKDPTSAAKNHAKRNKVERNLIKWANDHNQMIVAGHTHKAVFPTNGDPLYFNDGSCIHPRCITGIEITNGEIQLIKWSVQVDHRYHLYVGRTILEGPIELSSFL